MLKVLFLGSIPSSSFTPNFQGHVACVSLVRMQWSLDPASCGSHLFSVHRMSSLRMGCLSICRIFSQMSITTLCFWHSRAISRCSCMLSYSHSEIPPALVRDAFLLAVFGLLNGVSGPSPDQNQPVLFSCPHICWLRPQAPICTQSKSYDISMFDATSCGACWCARPVFFQASDRPKLCSSQIPGVWALAT